MTPSRSGPQDAVAVAPSVLREPYGHFGGAITLAVQTGGDRSDGAGLESVLQDAVDDWVAHAADYAAEERVVGMCRWKGRLRALVLPDTLDGPVVVAAGRTDEWFYDHAHVVGFAALRTVATAVARHLHAAGFNDAKVVKPKTRALPGRVHQAPNAVVLRAVERRSDDWDDAHRVKVRLVGAARRWVEQLAGPTYLSLGYFPVTLPSGVPEGLADLLVDLDVHTTLATGSVRTAVALASLGWREFDLGWGGRAVDRDGRLRRGQQLAAALDELGSALSYGCVSFDRRLWPTDDPAGAVRGWNTVHQARDAADTVVLDAFWAQLLTEEHLARAPTPRAGARAVDGRYVWQIAGPEEWLEPPTRERRREEGRRSLGASVVDSRSMIDLHHQQFRQWKASRPTPQDDRPTWALPVTPPEGMTRSGAEHRVVDPGIEKFTERFEAPDHRQLTVTQSIPAQRASTGNPWVETTYGLRVQEAGTPPDKPSRALFWSERGRSLSVSVNDAIAIDIHEIIRALHAQAQHQPRPPRP